MTDDWVELLLGYRKCGGTFWRLYKSSMTWHSAERRCAADGAHLAVVQTKDDRSCFKQVSSGYDYIFVGLNDQIEEDRFRWSDGQAVKENQLSWISSAPRSTTNLDCVIALGSSGHPYEYNCESYHFFTCQFPSKGKCISFPLLVCVTIIFL